MRTFRSASLSIREHRLISIGEGAPSIPDATPQIERAETTTAIDLNTKAEVLNQPDVAKAVEQQVQQAEAVNTDISRQFNDTADVIERSDIDQKELNESGELKSSTANLKAAAKLPDQPDAKADPKVESQEGRDFVDNITSILQERVLNNKEFPSFQDTTVNRVGSSNDIVLSHANPEVAKKIVQDALKNGYAVGGNKINQKTTEAEFNQLVDTLAGGTDITVTIPRAGQEQAVPVKPVAAPIAEGYSTAVEPAPLDESVEVINQRIAEREEQNVRDAESAAFKKQVRAANRELDRIEQTEARGVQNPDSKTFGEYLQDRGLDPDEIDPKDAAKQPPDKPAQAEAPAQTLATPPESQSSKPAQGAVETKEQAKADLDSKVDIGDPETVVAHLQDRFDNQFGGAYKGVKIENIPGNLNSYTLSAGETADPQSFLKIQDYAKEHGMTPVMSPDGKSMQITVNAWDGNKANNDAGYRGPEWESMRAEQNTPAAAPAPAATVKEVPKSPDGAAKPKGVAEAADGKKDADATKSPEAKKGGAKAADKGAEKSVDEMGSEENPNSGLPGGEKEEADKGTGENVTVEAETEKDKEGDPEKSAAVEAAEKVLENPDASEAERIEAVKELARAITEEGSEKNKKGKEESVDDTEAEATVEKKEKRNETLKEQSLRLTGEVRGEKEQTVEGAINAKEKGFEETKNKSYAAMDTKQSEISTQRDVIDGLENKLMDAKKKESGEGNNASEISAIETQIKAAEKQLAVLEQDFNTLSDNLSTVREAKDSDVKMLKDMKRETEQLSTKMGIKIKQISEKIANLNDGELASMVSSITVEHDGALGFKAENLQPVLNQLGVEGDAQKGIIENNNVPAVISILEAKVAPQK